MIKKFFIKRSIYIYTLELTNLDFGFRVKGWSFEDRVSNFKKFKIKIFKIKEVILVVFFIKSYFLKT